MSKSLYDDGLFYVMLLVNVAIVLALDYFPYADGINHIARYFLIKEALDGASITLDVSFKFLPSPYLAVDLVGVFLLSYFSPYFVAKIIAISALILPAIGFRMLVSSVNPSLRGLAIAATILSFNWCFFYGFFNYLIGFGLSMIFISLWWKSRVKNNVLSIILLAFFATVLYLIHMSAIAIVLVAIGSALCIHIFHCIKSGEKILVVFKSDSFFRYDFTALMVILMSVTFVAVVARLNLPQHASSIDVSALIFRTPLEKIKQIFSVMYSFSLLQLLISVFVYFATIFLILRHFYKSIKNYSFILTSIILFVFYLIFPVQFMGAYDVDIRFLLPAFLFVFLFDSSKFVTRRLMVSLFLLSGLNSLVAYYYTNNIDSKLESYANILNSLPENSRVLALVTDNAYGRIDVNRHFNLWHIINKNGYTNGLFNYEEHGPHLAHFSLNKSPYSVGDNWSISEDDIIEWDRIYSEYEYVIDVGSQEESTNILSKKLVKVTQDDYVSLYKIDAKL